MTENEQKALLNKAEHYVKEARTAIFKLGDILDEIRLAEGLERIRVYSVSELREKRRGG